MRKLVARGFGLEFVSLIALILSIALAWLGAILGLAPSVVISASVGLAVAAFTWALKWEIKREFKDKLSIYNLLETIEYEELYERGRIAIEECRLELEDLSQGILRIEEGHVARCMIKFTNAARHHVRLTHIGLDLDRLEMVLPTPDNPWYQHNLDLIKRKVDVERLFILRRSDTINSDTGMIEPDIADILEQQERDGVMVRVVWEEEVEDSEIIWEFIVVDARLVITGFQSWSGAGYANARVYRRKHEVDQHIEIFEALRAKAHDLSDLDDMLSTSNPVG